MNNRQPKTATDLFLRRSLHSVRMALPTVAVVIGMWLFSGDDTGGHIAGIAFMAGGVWRL